MIIPALRRLFGSSESLKCRGLVLGQVCQGRDMMHRRECFWMERSYVVRTALKGLPKDRGGKTARPERITLWKLFGRGLGTKLRPRLGCTQRVMHCLGCSVFSSVLRSGCAENHQLVYP